MSKWCWMLDNNRGIPSWSTGLDFEVLCTLYVHQLQWVFKPIDGDKNTIISDMLLPSRYTITEEIPYVWLREKLHLKGTTFRLNRLFLVF